MIRFRLIFILLLLSLTSFSQVIEENRYTWLRGGIGGFKEQNINKLRGGIFNLSVNYLTDKYIQKEESIRAVNHLWEIRGDLHINSGDEHTMGLYYDLGLLYGKSAGDAGKIYICAGLGVMGGWYNVMESVPYKFFGTVKHEFSVLNIPIETGFNVNSEKFGIGISGIANINKTMSTLGITLHIQLGRLR